MRTPFSHLESDILQERVFQDCLELLVDLQGELQRHVGVAQAGGVQGGHHAAGLGQFSLQAEAQIKVMARGKKYEPKTTPQVPHPKSKEVQIS